MFLIVFDSMLAGMDAESFKKIIDFETGHIKIFSSGYQEDIDNLPIDINISKPNSLINKLRKDPDVAGITSRVHFRITLSDGIDTLPAVGLAIDPKKDKNVFLMEQAILEGDFLSGNDDEMLLGEGLAQDFNVSVGDYLTVLTRTKYDTYQALDLMVAGIVRTEDPKIDWSSAIIPLKLGQDALDLEGAVTEIDIKLKDPEKINVFKDKLAKEITGVEVATWRDLAEDVIAISETKYGSSMILFASVVIIALVGIANTILLAAFERVKEIGMMAAMGLKRRQIIKLFVLEGTMIGLFGSIIGCLLGTFLVLTWLTNGGIDYSAFGLKEMGDIGYRTTGKMLGVWNPSMVVIAFIFGIVAAALSSIYPAWLASKMEPTEALRKT